MLLKYNSINRANYYNYSYFNKKLLNINTYIKLQFKNNTNNTPTNNTPTNNTPTNNTLTNNTLTNNTPTNTNTLTNNNYKKQFINNLKKIEMHESHSIKPFLYIKTD